MTEPFAEIVGPYIRAVVGLQQGFEAGRHPDLESVRAQIVALLAEADQKVARSGQLGHDFALARHALVYWTDEVLIDSTWTHAQEWKEHILEMQYYGDRNRARRFFEKAREAETLAGTDPLEVFFLAVALGFRGDYAIDEPGLHGWAERAYGRIAASSRQPERFLPDEDRGDLQPLQPLPGKGQLLTVSVLVSVTAIVTLVCFLVSIQLAT